MSQSKFKENSSGSGKIQGFIQDKSCCYCKDIIAYQTTIYNQAPYVQNMNRQQRENSDNRGPVNQLTTTSKIHDFLSQMEKKSTEIEVFLSSSQIQHLNVEHQLLISSATMSQMIRTFDKQISPLFLETANPEIIKLYNTWREWMQNSIGKNNSERRQLVQRLIGNDDKDKRKNPADDYQKRKSQIISREIRQRQQFFKIKTNFAAYAKDHFQQQTQQIKDLVDFKAKRVQEKIIIERFKKLQEQKLNQIFHTFDKREKQEQNHLLLLMRQASKIKKLDVQKKLFLIGQRQKSELTLRHAACKQLGNSVCLLINIHDAMAFSKK